MKNKGLKSSSIEKEEFHEKEDSYIINKSDTKCCLKYILCNQQTVERYRTKHHGRIHFNHFKFLFFISFILYTCTDTSNKIYQLRMQLPMMLVEGYAISKWNTRSMIGFRSTKCDLPSIFTKRSIHQLSNSKNFSFHHKKYIIQRSMQSFSHHELAPSKTSSVFSRISSLHKIHRNKSIIMQSIKHLTHDEPSSMTASSTTSQAKKDSTDSYWEHVFSIQLPEGHCVAMRLNLPLNDDDTLPTSKPEIFNDDFWMNLFGPSSSLPLHPDEMKYGISIPNLREAARTSFFIGRLSLHAALNEVVQNQNQNQKGLDVAILKDEHGRPIMPDGYLGSISHKRNTGVALVDVDVDNGGKRRGIGIDIEQSFSRRLNVAKRVLTNRELDELGKIEVDIYCI